MKKVVKIDKDYEALIPVFLSNHVKLIKALQVASESYNLDEIRFLGHRLKGTAKNYGFDELGTLGEKLELAVEDEDIKTLIIDIKNYMNSVEIMYVEK